MALLAGAVVLLVLGHAIPSAPPVRRALLGALGRAGFYTLYSLTSLALLMLVIVAYRAADPGVWLYTRNDLAPLLAILLMPLALFLIVGRLTTPARTPPIGIDRLTSAPGSVGALVWASLHLLNLGGGRQVILFAGMAAIALIALIKNHMVAAPERKRAGWLPAFGILSGREKLVWQEIGWWRAALTLVLYASLLWLHPLVFGRDPLLAAGF